MLSKFIADILKYETLEVVIQSKEEDSSGHMMGILNKFNL